MVVLDLCYRMIRKLPYEFTVLYSFWAILFITYAAATVSIFVECRPFKLYWQLSPDPGECVQGNVWLLTYGIGNTVTDSMLLALPFPLLFQARTSTRKKAWLLTLFSLGFLLIGISVVRIIQGNRHAHIQLSRVMWASIETLFASIVAMFPAIYVMLRPIKANESYDMSGLECRRTTGQVPDPDHRCQRTILNRSMTLRSPYMTTETEGAERFSWLDLAHADTKRGDAASAKSILGSMTVR